MDNTEYSDKDYLDFFWDDVNENAEVLREVTWQHGSWAYVKSYRNIFISSDEIQNYGPFATYEEAEDILEISELYDKINHDVLY